MLSGLIQLAASPSGAQASHPGTSGKATAAASHGGSAGASSPGSSEMQPAAILLGLLDQYNGLQRMALDLSLRAVQSATHQVWADAREQKLRLLDKTSELCLDLTTEEMCKGFGINQPHH